jgi:tRNA(Ile)-lysidine synthetase-like protein
VEECLLPFRNSTGEQCIELKIENLRLQIIFRSQVQSQLLQFPLVLRNRKPGDRIGTTTKLKDVLIADRVPVEIREKLLLVSDATGQVIYVSGMPRINCRIQKRGFPEVEIHILD